MDIPINRIGTVPHRTVPYATVSYRIVPYHTLPYRTVQYLTVLYHTVPYFTIALPPYHDTGMSRGPGSTRTRFSLVLFVYNIRYCKKTSESSGYPCKIPSIQEICRSVKVHSSYRTVPYRTVAQLHRIWQRLTYFKH